MKHLVRGPKLVDIIANSYAIIYNCLSGILMISNEALFGGIMVKILNFQTNPTDLIPESDRVSGGIYSAISITRDTDYIIRITNKLSKDIQIYYTFITSSPSNLQA